MAGPGESQCNCNEQDDTRLEMRREGSWGQSVPTSVYHAGYQSDLCSEKSFWLLSGSELGAGRWEAVLCGVISKAVAVERDVPLEPHLRGGSWNSIFTLRTKSHAPPRPGMDQLSPC